MLRDEFIKKVNELVSIVPAHNQDSWKLYATPLNSDGTTDETVEIWVADKCFALVQDNDVIEVADFTETIFTEDWCCTSWEGKEFALYYRADVKKM